MIRSLALCFLAVIAFVLSATRGQAQDYVSEQPIYEAHSAYPLGFVGIQDVPTVVPSDALLDHADQIQPPTPEGWIVNRVPVTECNVAGGNHERMLQIRELDSRIRIASAEVQSWKKKLDIYRQFDKYNALPVTVENARLALLESQERLNNLRYERMLLIRQRNLEYKLKTQGIVLHREVISP